MAKRVFLIVLDSCGIGEEPDAHEFGDHDCNTMKRISAHPAYRNDTMRKLGLANIDGQEYLGPVDQPLAAVARLQEASRGKDTTIGHWEIAGIQSDQPMPTYPQGFPEEVLRAVELLTHKDGVDYFDYVRAIRSDPLAVKVKLADLEHNSDATRLGNITDRDRERLEKYKKAKQILLDN